MQVRRHQEEPSGSVSVSESFPHRVALGAVHADSPARIKVAYALGVAAFLSCYWCWLQGERCASGYEGKGQPTQYPKSYHRGTRQTKHGNGVVMKMGDARLPRADEEQLQRGNKAVEHLQDASLSAKRVSELHSDLGCKGISVLFTTLPYLSPNNTFLVPLAHGLYYGVVKSFVEYALRSIKDGEDPIPDDVISKPARVQIGLRAAHVALTSDFGRMYRCVLSARGTWRMEDWQHFVESISLYIFSGDVLPPKLRRIWDMLCQISVHFARPPPAGQQGVGAVVGAVGAVGAANAGAAGAVGAAAGAAPGAAGVGQRGSGQRVGGQGTGGHAGASSMSDAAHLLRKVGELYELYKFPDCMFTYNLHMLACRLGVQEMQRGPVSSDTELFLERGVRGLKKYCQGRVSADPEKAYANHLLLQQQLASAVLQSSRMLELQKWMQAGFRKGAARGEHYDDGEGSLLLGAGRVPARQLLSTYKDSVKQYLVDMPTRGWVAEDVDKAFMAGSKRAGAESEKRLVHTYKRSSVHDEELVGTLEASLRGRARQNCWVAVEWHGRPQVCAIRSLLRVVHPGAAEHMHKQAAELASMRATHERQVQLKEAAQRQRLLQGNGMHDTEGAVQLALLQQQHAAAEAELRAKHRDNPPPEVLRLALCKVYAPLPTLPSKLFQAENVQVDWYPVDLNSIESKLIAFFPMGEVTGRMYFAQFHNLSKSF